LERQAMTNRIPSARRIPFDAPWAWLAAGWRDMWRVPHISLAYGLAVATVAGAMILELARHGALSLFLPLSGGFLLIGPLLAVGLYDTSRRLARGENPTLSQVLSAGFRARGQLGFFSVVLLFVFLVWLQLAFLLLMLFLGTTSLPPPSAFVHELLFTPRGLGLLIVGTLVGSALAAAVYAISAFAIPILLRHEMDAVTAARTSVVTVHANPKPSLLWAGLIAMIIIAGFAMLLVGLVLAFPLIGHATWHAYADVFAQSEEPVESTQT
jgi:uncharacterized membrane protein